MSFIGLDNIKFELMSKINQAFTHQCCVNFKREEINMDIFSW